MTTARQESHPLIQAFVVNGGLVAFMWILEFIDTITAHSLDAYGIQPRNVAGLGDIFLAPWLHFGWAHIASNTVPFLVLGMIIYLSGAGKWLVTTLVTIIVSGLTVWLLAPPMSMTLGASGIVFGFLTYVLVRGIFTRKPGQIAIAVIVMMVYGGVLWGVLPTAAGVSWQAHLGGAVGGVLSAWLMHAKGDRKPQGKAEYWA